jgi:hypothetical protein
MAFLTNVWQLRPACLLSSFKSEPP